MIGIIRRAIGLRENLQRGARMQLQGEYIGGGFVGEDLSDAELSGTFVNVDFRGANLSGAELNGTFVNSDFSDADLTDADLDNGYFVGVTFGR